MREARPEVLEAVTLADEFCSLIRKGKPEQFDHWLKQASESSLQAFVRFGEGLRADYEAVKAAMDLPWSNGQVEGQVNQLKMLKCQM